jgi:hypothetical protein
LSKISIKAAIGNDIVLGEQEVGQAPSRICYPGVSSCIAITLVSQGFLNGVHLTVATEPDKVDTALDILGQYCPNGCSAIYVVGKIAEFKAKTVDKRLSTRKKMSQLLRETFGIKGGTIEFCDSTQYGHGSNIAATRTPVGVQFGWQDDKTRVNYFTIPADLNNYTPIPTHAFARR